MLLGIVYWAKNFFCKLKKTGWLVLPVIASLAGWFWRGWWD